MRLEADIAGVRVAIDAPPSWIDGPIAERFGRFPARDVAAAALTVELVEHAGPSCRAESWRGAGAFFAAAASGLVPDYPLEIGRDGDRLEVEGPFMTGAIDLRAGTGSGLACDRGALGSLENFLRVGVAHLLLPRGGFLLHASAVLVGDGVVVGFGESGAGKTTLASLAAGRPVVSDDLVALARDASGRLVVIPSPFRAGGAPAEPRGHRVRALLKLRKAAPGARDAEARAFSAREGAATLLASMPFVLDHPASADAALALAARAAEDPGVGELVFAPVPGVWDAIEEAV